MAGETSGAGGAGVFLQAAAALNGAIGSFYAAKTAKNQLKSQALLADYDATVSLMNARNAEVEAQSILSSGAKDIGLFSLGATQQIEAQKASMGARGIVGSVGSSAESLASQELSKQIDMLAIDTNRTRAAAASRVAGAQHEANAGLAQVSARNLWRTAKSINPWVAAGNSLLGSSGDVASQWYTYKQSTR